MQLRTACTHVYAVYAVHVFVAHASYMHLAWMLLPETSHLFNTITHPYITSLPPDNTTWVKNIVNREKEAERVSRWGCDGSGAYVACRVSWHHATCSMPICAHITPHACTGALRRYVPHHWIHAPSTPQMGQLRRIHPMLSRIRA